MISTSQLLRESGFAQYSAMVRFKYNRENTSLGAEKLAEMVRAVPGSTRVSTVSLDKEQGIAIFTVKLISSKSAKDAFIAFKQNALSRFKGMLLSVEVGAGSIEEKGEFILNEQLLMEVSIDQLKTQWVDSGKMQQDVFDRICRTVHNKSNNATWLVKKVADGLIPDSEIEAWEEALEVFERYKSRFPIKDLNQIKTQEQIYAFLDTVQDIQDAAEAKKISGSGKSSAKDLIADSFVANFRTSDGTAWRIYAPKTYEAERVVGSGTSWCTVASRSMYDQYLRRGGRYIIFIDKNNPDKKWQLHQESDQFKDKSDGELSGENRDIAIELEKKCISLGLIEKLTPKSKEWIFKKKQVEEDLQKIANMSPEDLLLVVERSCIAVVPGNKLFLFDTLPSKFSFYALLRYFKIPGEESLTKAALGDSGSISAVFRPNVRFIVDAEKKKIFVISPYVTGRSYDPNGDVTRAVDLYEIPDREFISIADVITTQEEYNTLAKHIENLKTTPTLQHFRPKADADAVNLSEFKERETITGDLVAVRIPAGSGVSFDNTKLKYVKFKNPGIVVCEGDKPRFTLIPINGFRNHTACITDFDTAESNYHGSSGSIGAFKKLVLEKAGSFEKASKILVDIFQKKYDLYIYQNDGIEWWFKNYFEKEWTEAKSDYPGVSYKRVRYTNSYLAPYGISSITCFIRHSSVPDKVILIYDLGKHWAIADTPDKYFDKIYNRESIEKAPKGSKALMISTFGEEDASTIAQFMLNKDEYAWISRGFKKAWLDALVKLLPEDSEERSTAERDASFRVSVPKYLKAMEESGKTQPMEIPIYMRGAHTTFNMNLPNAIGGPWEEFKGPLISSSPTTTNRILDRHKTAFPNTDIYIYYGGYGSDWHMVALFVGKNDKRIEWYCRRTGSGQGLTYAMTSIPLNKQIIFRAPGSNKAPEVDKAPEQETPQKAELRAGKMMENVKSASYIIDISENLDKSLKDLGWEGVPAEDFDKAYEYRSVLNLRELLLIKDGKVDGLLGERYMTGSEYKTQLVKLAARRWQTATIMLGNSTKSFKQFIQVCHELGVQYPDMIPAWVEMRGFNIEDIINNPVTGRRRRG